MTANRLRFSASLLAIALVATPAHAQETAASAQPTAEARALMMTPSQPIFTSASAQNDTLAEALVDAYRTNPTLTAQRESLKSSDASVAIARAAGRPTVSGVVGVNRNLTRSGIIAQTSTSDRPITLSGGVDLSLPLFQGGQVRNNIKAAKARNEAGRATLEAVEGDVFVDAVSAYMDVIRDRAIVELNQNQIRVLDTNYRATSDRFEIGDLTRTDVAQSQARLEQGRASLASAEGRLRSSEENYRRVIGHAPGRLAPPPPLPPLPGSPDQAVRIALVDNPDLAAIEAQAVAAGYDVASVRGSRLPSVSGVVSGDYVNTVKGDVPTGFDRSGTSTAVGLNARIPIYQGGAPAARIRQARAIEGQLGEQVVGTERAVVAVTRSAFATYQAAKSAIASNQLAIEANSLALRGARAENSIGTRTILEVLNAEQELLTSQVNYVSSQRDAYVAGFQLLNAMGQAQAEDLNLAGGALYDPLGNYRRVAGDLFDWESEGRHPVQATRTVTAEESPKRVTPATR